ncbi:ATP-dependent helicase [Segatella copri]|jgi:DNA helicase-2/ATP-dependent DNA helicase PcrA|uniref:DNA 3'-5' helicase n=1 Tax=Segatella copri TaxID=165179 RepID=A0AAW5HZF5_9BACT|nr:UvrD-helicase domain-containing protein [Segatella copri]MCF0066469.1 UvrD-helicase domain-containing protein [Segatella copri]MCP9457955.1 UvrD-helicase domain-containing protein [Segatella copri]MCP9500530.1 UvrD-helicase domain-containing protein [Segatella copri]MCP9503605.1 UvrD-helicase domain-containing protein [Segatella copri]MCP9506562.1 UvrD-helicase domain-containing protein [Segatella copri]
MDLLNDLNEAQRAAVEYIDGPSLVIAGAGSGKTRVLTYKIAYLLSQGMKPWSIMALTFTNKAAREMKERIGKLVGNDLAQHLYMGTFHSIFSRILRAEAEHIGFNNNFTIYDESDSRSLIKAIVKEMGLDDKKYKPAAVHAKISMAKNNLMSAAAYESDAAIFEQNKRAQIPEVGKIFVAYVQRCKQANAMDFDDLLTLTYQLFREHEDIRHKYAARFDYVLVDEYQDTNHVQMSIVMQLCQEKQRVCAVGDDSQSIYSFRGANIDNILNYQRQFQGTRLFKLEQNYRSTQTIVEAANSLIKHNRNQIPKDVFSENAKGEKIQYKPAYSDKEEAVIVAKDVKRIRREDGCQYSDFAILYRTNAQSRSFEEEFRKQGIPYRIYGGLSFYQRKEIKDIIAYFRLVANPDDEEAIKRIINYPARGIGATTVLKIADCAHQNQVSFWEVIGAPEQYGLAVNKGTMNKLETFRLLISSFIERAQTTDVYELGDAIIKESGISQDIMSGKDADDLARQENLEEFLSGMSAFVEERREEGRFDELFLQDYLQDVALLTDADSDGDKDEPRVSLMTVHAAKGLEFPTVFVVGLEENIFPSPLSAASLRELEEERRLLYVAITRAEKHCILTNAKNRWRYGKMEFDNPSRFIDEIDGKLIDSQDEAGGSLFGSMSESRLGSRSGSRFGSRADSMSDQPEWARAQRPRRPWEDAEQPRYSSRYQNSKPVASQFVADPKPSLFDDEPETSRTSGRSSLSEGNFKSVRALNAAKRYMETHSSHPASSGTGSSAVSVSSSAASSAGSSSCGLQEGMKIEHQRFGRGTVLKIEGTGENTKATVEFVHSGTKQLLLKYAKFTVVD